MPDKIKYFEYFLKQLVEWFCEYYKIDREDFNGYPKNNLSKLKVFKLHFFACSTMPEEALGIFNKFRALPYGHVESEVYGKLFQLQNFKLGNDGLEILNDDYFGQREEDGKETIVREMVFKLKKENFELISWDPFELVELSHKWFSWRYNYEKARRNNKYAEDINSDIIKLEDRIYHLS